MNDSFEMNKSFCCPGLQHRVGDAGSRGIAVLVRKTPEGIRFMLQSRGIAFEDEKKIHPMSLDININVSCEIGLQFCPFCGRRLRELVEAAPEAFANLVEKHRRFLPQDLVG